MPTDEGLNIAHDDKRTQSGSAALVLSPSRTGSRYDDYVDKIEEQDVSSDEREDAEGGGILSAEDIEKATAASVEKQNTKISVNNVVSIPDGGIRAWMQVVGSFFIFFNTW